MAKRQGRRTKSAENIWRQPSGRYLVRWRDPAGREHSQVFPTFEQARDFRDDVAVSKRRGNYVPPSGGKTTLGTYYAARMAERGDLTEQTRSLYKASWRNYVAPSFADWPLSGITRPDVKSWASDLESRGVKPSAVEVAYRLLRSLLAEAVRDGKLALNPAAHITISQAPQRKHDPLNAEQVARLIDAADERDQALLLLLALGGLRIGEAIALRVADVDLLKRTVTVGRAFTEVNGRIIEGETKNKRVRTVYIPAAVADAIAAHIDAHGKRDSKGQVDRNQLVFTAPGGGPIRRGNFRRRVWEPALGRASLPYVRLHDLRHGAVSLAIASGANVKLIQEMAGHSKITTTIDRYGHLFDDAAEALAGQLDATFRTAADLVRTKTAETVVALPVRESESAV